MVEDDADDRSIMPQRRLEKPTIEKWSCHSILQNASTPKGVTLSLVKTR